MAACCMNTVAFQNVHMCSISRKIAFVHSTMTIELFFIFKTLVSAFVGLTIPNVRIAI